MTHTGKKTLPLDTMATEGTKDIMTEARNFTSSLSNVFLLKKRDQQSKHLLEKAKTIIEGLIAENQKISSGSSTPRQARSTGGMGQLWVKLDELKRENDDLKRQRGRSQEDRCSSPKDKVYLPGDSKTQTCLVTKYIYEGRRGSKIKSCLITRYIFTRVQ